MLIRSKRGRVALARESLCCLQNLGIARPPQTTRISYRRPDAVSTVSASAVTHGLLRRLLVPPQFTMSAPSTTCFETL